MGDEPVRVTLNVEVEHDADATPEEMEQALRAAIEDAARKAGVPIENLAVVLDPFDNA
ncbi:MAG: hypothetical protein M3Q30_19780 [Actinomycetota bacterium]|nr:hypothetical protein [Actinomycetota bacterium]